MSLLRFIWAAPLLLLLNMHTSAEALEEPGVKPIAPTASPQTIMLYQNLYRLGATHMLFGHQNTTAYGVNWLGDANRSDIKDVTGSYPAVFGWDLGLLEQGRAQNLDGISFEFIRTQIQAAYQRGAVSTLSWHMSELITGQSAWSKTENAQYLLPGKKHHQKLKHALDRFIEFNQTLLIPTSEQGSKLIPIIFRPWHEHNGDWFWWGKGHISESNFIELWQFTVNYLTVEHPQNNLLFAFSPDRSRIKLKRLPQAYFYGYPGDKYVDIIGLDNYWDFGHPMNKAPQQQQFKDLITSLTFIGQTAAQKQKIAAMTEGGQETISNSQFWTDIVLKAYSNNKHTQNIAYFMVWRNANRRREKIEHYYAPYKEHSSSKNFKQFYQSPYTLFEKELPPLYKPNPLGTIEKDQGLKL